MPAKFTLGKNERLKRRKIIEQLFAEGKSIAVFPLRVNFIFVTSLTVPLQAGFSVSARTFKRAADRNRIKRLMREAYRLQKGLLYESLHKKQQQMALFVIYTGKELPDYKTVSEKKGVVLNKLTKVVNEIPAPHA